MSKPETNINVSNPVQSALNEVVSAMSALNMEPRPLDKPEGDYLSERDAWAKHAMEHLRAAVQLLNKAWQDREKASLEVWRLEKSNAALRAALEKTTREKQALEEVNE